ncbi:MAG: DMT family transporter [Methanobacteriota archaeon]|nr:MAG: DMT family transporter [Euryarchaeota archaeon]
MAGELLAISATITFVLSSAMFRKVEAYLTSAQISAFRTLVGLITFYIIGLVSNLFHYALQISLNLILLLIVSILAGQVIGDTLYLLAQERIGTSLSIALSTTFPFFTFFIAYVVRKETVPDNFLVSAALISIGVIIISQGRVKDNDNIDSYRNISVTSVLIGLLASIFWGIATVYTDLSLDLVADALPENVDPTIVGNIVRFPFAVVALGALSSKMKKTSFLELDRYSLAWLVGGAVIGTSLGAYLWAESARVAGASLSALVYSSAPLFALPIGFLLNGERINIIGFLGSLVTAVGVALIFI